jgi:hypothetical protein
VEAFFVRCGENQMPPLKLAKSLVTHPYTLNAIDQIPEPLLTLANGYLPENQTCEGILIVPPETYRRGFRSRTMPLRALIFTGQGILSLSEPANKGQAGVGIWISADDILKIKLSLILLYGKLEIWGIQNGQTSKIEIEYNTVIQPSLAPMLQSLIRKTWLKNPVNRTQYPQDESFMDFVKISYSFYNGITLKAMQPGEKIVGYLYQPEIREPKLKYFQHKISPRTVVCITDQQVILLQEDLNVKTHHEWLFTFIPLYRIAHLGLETDRDWQKLSFSLLPSSLQEKVEVLLETEKAQKWYSAWSDGLSQE